ncbi:MAG: cyclic nucleotide-binding domain-containing protein [Anaerolineales bacterium]|jgi:CRP-like cAMP-binding protein
MPQEIFDLLPLFHGFSQAQLDLLRPLFIPCDCYTDTVLFEQGERARYLYIVVSGDVAILYKPEDAPSISLTSVQPGGVVGWSAVLGNRFYTSSAVCSAYSQMLRVSGEDLRVICKDYPELGILILERLASVIAERLHSSRDQIIALLKEGLGSKTETS